MLCKRGLSRPSCGVWMSVCVSVTFVDCAKTNKHIFSFFRHRHTILVFLRTKRHGNILTGSPLTGSRMQVVWAEIAFWAYIQLHCVLSTLQPARCYRRRTTVPQAVTLIAGSKRRSWLVAGDNDGMFRQLTRSLNVTPKTTEQRSYLHAVINL